MSINPTINKEDDHRPDAEKTEARSSVNFNTAHLRPKAAHKRNAGRVVVICICAIFVALAVFALAFGKMTHSGPPGANLENGVGSASITDALASDASTVTAGDDVEATAGADGAAVEDQSVEVGAPQSTTAADQQTTSDQDTGASSPDNANVPIDATSAEDPRLKESTSKNNVKPKDRVVYLTFDDGPSNITPKILATLKKNDVKATWFVSGSHSNLDQVKKIWNAGHQIALHTNTHNYKKIYKSKNAFFKDMDAIAKKVEKRIGVSPKLIRFPGGSINSYNKKTVKKIKKELRARNWHYFDWNASIEDAVSPKMRSTMRLIKTAKKQSAGKHSICLLMHDTDAKKTTARALDKIIKYYKKKGYKFEYLTADSFGYHF